MSTTVAGKVMPIIAVGSVDQTRDFYVDTLGFTHLEVEDVDGLHGRLQRKGVPIVEPLTLQWWGDRTFKVKDPNGYVIWFYTNVGEPKPPQGMKVV